MYDFRLFFLPRRINNQSRRLAVDSQIDSLKTKTIYLTLLLAFL